MILVAALLLSLAQPGESQEEPSLDPHCPRGDLNASRPADLLCIGRLTRSYAFAVTYPRALAAMPPLLQLVRARAASDEARLRRQAGAEWAARQGDAEPPRFFHDEAWDLDVALPELAAASSTAQTYLGGAHEGISYDVILLDRRAGRPITLAALFSGRGGTTAIARGLCRALTGESRSRRDDPAAAPDCPSPASQPITLLCTNGRIDRLRALIAPYVIGSWAEGPHEVEFPVTAAMRAAVAPRFRAAFAPRPGTGLCRRSEDQNGS